MLVMGCSNKPISNYRIRKIIFHFCVDINASKAAVLLDINRNTINKYFNIFRKLIYGYQTELLKRFVGELELDESYFGASRVRGFKGKLKKGRGTIKQPVFGLFKRSGRVYTEIIPNCKKPTMRAIILGKIDSESIIYTDGWRGYDGLVDVGYDKHFRVNHSQNEFSRGNGVHINGIESFWSYTKRRLTKFNGTKVNFPLHLKECEWRWNKTVVQLQKELEEMLKERRLLV